MARVTVFLRTKENYTREEYKSILQEVNKLLQSKNIRVSDIFDVHTDEEVEKQIEDNLNNWCDFKSKFDSAREYAGITQEQACKFMDGFKK